MQAVTGSETMSSATLPDVEFTLCHRERRRGEERTNQCGEEARPNSTEHEQAHTESALEGLLELILGTNLWDSMEYFIELRASLSK